MCPAVRSKRSKVKKTFYKLKKLQTRRSNETVYKDHIRHFRFVRVETFTVAQHLIKCGHHIKKHSPRGLDVYNFQF